MVSPDLFCVAVAVSQSVMKDEEVEEEERRIDGEEERRISDGS